jgi:hypothetical protein
MRNADILGFVDHNKVARHGCAGGQRRGPPTEHLRVGDVASGLQLAADALKHRPEDGPLRLRQSRFFAQAPDVPIRLSIDYSWTPSVLTHHKGNVRPQ